MARSNSSANKAALVAKANADIYRAQLREAFRMAIDGEQRFGQREGARPELDQRWDRVIDLTIELCRKPTKI